MKPYNINNVWTHASFFYSGKWTAEMDAKFVSELVDQKKTVMWIPPNVPPMSVILEAMHAVIASTGRHIAFEDASERVDHLRTRYETFRKMLKLDGAYWDRVENKVVMSDKSWTKISKKMPIARAYWFNGEPEFLKLEWIFGPTVLKQEDGPPVIDISDNTVRINQPEYVNLIESDSEEVTSPIGTSLRRRLFAEAAESTTASRIQPNAFPPRNRFPPPGFSDSAGPTDEGSPVASSVSWKWWNESSS